MPVRIVTKLQVIMTVAATIPVIVIIFLGQTAIGAGTAALIGLLGPFLATHWLVTKDLQEIRDFCRLVKEGRYRLHTALPNEAAHDGEENEFISVLRDMNWMAQEIKLREVQLTEAISELDTAQEELLEQKKTLEAVNQQLSQMAMTDPLTGLSNRRHFFDHLEQEVCRTNRSGRPIALFILDVDYFKKVNDTYGHQAGDDVLKAIAQILRNRLRRSDMAARIGGEEFAVLLSETGITQAMEVADQIRDSVKEYMFSTGCGKNIRITCSVGVCGSDESEYSSTELLYKYADLALYNAKNTGRDRVVCYACVAPEKELTGVAELPEQKGVTH